MHQPPKELEKFESLLQVIEALRGPDGCPWDIEQTHRSLAPYAIEEAHELAEAIEKCDEAEMITELGDLLLQVVIHAEIGRQEKRFSIHDVIKAINEKMISRHPHVFSDVKVADSKAVLANWSKIKEEEKAKKAKQANHATQATHEEMRFDVPLSLPSLQRAQKIGEKTHRLRFDWPGPKEVFEKVREEFGELQEELDKGEAAQKSKLEHEIGDLLFSIAQFARHVGLEAEQCLRTGNSRFEKRYFTMTKMLAEQKRDYEKLSTAELEEAWQATKKTLLSE